MTAASTRKLLWRRNATTSIPEVRVSGPPPGPGSRAHSQVRRLQTQAHLRAGTLFDRTRISPADITVAIVIHTPTRSCRRSGERNSLLAEHESTRVPAASLYLPESRVHPHRG